MSISELRRLGVSQEQAEQLKNAQSGAQHRPRRTTQKDTIQSAAETQPPVAQQTASRNEESSFSRTLSAATELAQNACEKLGELFKSLVGFIVNRSFTASQSNGSEGKPSPELKKLGLSDEQVAQLREAPSGVQHRPRRSAS